MQIYLPIAEISVNLWLLIGLGGLTGVLSGLFGVGGGFLTTPFLMFIGVPPAVAVATSANQIVATSFSGFLAYMRKSAVDFKMGGYLLAGGMVGSSLGVMLFAWITRAGYVDIFVPVSYVFFLGTVGSLMAAESLRSLRGKATHHPHHRAKWREKLPWQVHFPHSQLTVSGFLPLAVGAFVGVLVSVMGVGGGFFLVPALLYILGMHTRNVVGTSLFQIIFITAHVTLLQAITTQTVDLLLALILLSGSVFGAQLGSKLSHSIASEKLRAMLAVIVLSVALRLAYGLFVTPTSLYSVGVL
jgi:uncharacterized protein